MSHDFYDRQWQAAMEELAEQIEIENPPPVLDHRGRVVPEKAIPWDDAFSHYAALYMRYIQIMRKLDDCYDQIIHPQKRRDIKKALETVMARICQIKRELVRFGPHGRQSDYVNLEELLVDLKLPPEAAEIPVPRYFRARDDEQYNKKRELLDTALADAHVASDKPSEPALPSLLTPVLTREQAIRIILKNERGREGAARCKRFKKFRDEEALRKRLTGNGQHEGDPTMAATLIQRVFRGFSSRIRTREDADKELAFVGMRPGERPVAAAKKSGAGGVYDPLEKEAKIRRQRHDQQHQNEMKYVEALTDLEKSVTEAEGPVMKDEMWDERYQWWIEQKRKTGRYPDTFDLFYKEKAMPILTPEEKAAKAAALVEEEKQKAIEARKRERERKRRGPFDAKDVSKKGAAAAEPAAPTFRSRRRAEEEKKALEKINSTTTIGPSILVTHALESVAKYKSVWAQLDESENYHQTHDESLAREKLRPLVREKIQKEVDITLLRYLDNIKLKVQQRKALARKTKKRSKKGSKKKSSEEKKEGDGGEEKKEEKKSEGKEEKKGDASGDEGGGGAPKKPGTKKKKIRTLKKKKKRPCCIGEALVNRIKPQEELIGILVKMGILQELRKPVSLKEFIGPLHLLGTAYAAAGVNLDPSPSQIRQCVTEYCILPLGSSYVKEQTPLLNTLLLYGPSGSGKTLLSKAIASETGSTWFDLSPKNIERKLGTKSDIARMVHMVFQVAIDLAPSVIYIDDAEKVFVSAKSKKTSDIVKMKQFIMQHKNSLTRQQRVLVIGNSRIPYHEKVDRKDLNRFFGYRNYGKMIFCPCPSYAARLQLWRHFINQTGMSIVEMEKNSKFDLTTLANISEGYSAGSIQQAVQAVLPDRRVAKLLESGRTIENTELITAISKTTYTYKDDYLSMQRFTDDVTGERDRRKLALQAEKREQEEAAIAAASKRRAGMFKRRPAAAPGEGKSPVPPSGTLSATAMAATATGSLSRPGTSSGAAAMLAATPARPGTAPGTLPRLGASAPLPPITPSSMSSSSFSSSGAGGASSSSSSSGFSSPGALPPLTPGRTVVRPPLR